MSKRSLLIPVLVLLLILMFISQFGGINGSNIDGKSGRMSASSAVSLVTGDITSEAQKHEERVRDSILALGEADSVDQSLSPEQRKINTIQRSLLRLPAAELSYLPFPLTADQTILINTPEAEMLVQAWEERQRILQEALKSMVKPAEKMTELMKFLNEEIPAYMAMLAKSSPQPASDSSSDNMSEEELVEQLRIKLSNSHVNDKKNKIVSFFVNLEEYLSDLDNARDFHTMGLWPRLLSFMHSSYPPIIRSHAAWNVGSAIQGVFAYNQLKAQGKGREGNKNKQNSNQIEGTGILEVSDEEIEEHHMWLLEEFSIILERVSQSSETSNVTESIQERVSANGLSLLTQLLVDYHHEELRVTAGSAMTKMFDMDYVKKALYAIAAALRGSFETQVALTEFLQRPENGHLAQNFQRVLYSIASLHNSHVNDGANAVVKSENESRHQYESMRRVWALGADLAQELFTVVEEYHRLLQQRRDAYIRLRLHIQDGQEMEGKNTTHNADVQVLQEQYMQKQMFAQQAAEAMVATPFIYPALFLKNPVDTIDGNTVTENEQFSFYRNGERLVSSIISQQQKILSMVATSAHLGDDKLRKEYNSLRAVRRDLLRYLVHTFKLFQLTTQCDTLSNSTSLWTTWISHNSDSAQWDRDVLYSNMLEILAQAESILAAEMKHITDTELQNELLGNDIHHGVVGGVDEELVEIVQSLQHDLADSSLVLK